MEILLSHPKSRVQTIQQLLAETDKRNSQLNLLGRKELQLEIGIISECLRGEDKSPSVRRSSAPTVESMCPSDWIEDAFQTCEPSSTSTKMRIILPRGRIYNRLEFSAAGLSTACSHVYFLSKKMFLVYRLAEKDKEIDQQPTFAEKASCFKYYAAALSERFIVILLTRTMSTTLKVLRYDGEVVGTDEFGSEPNGHRWNASDLITIHENCDRTWIAVGGSAKQDDRPTGSIKMYCVEEAGSAAVLRLHDVSFDRSRPNPLALNLLTTLDFSPNGKHLVCTTLNNHVLVWRLSNNMRRRGSPFMIEKALKTVSFMLKTSLLYFSSGLIRVIVQDIGGGKISSAALFHSALSHPYLLCTTMPSLERVVNQGEWSFISPVGSGPAQVSDRLIHELHQLKEPTLLGAVAPGVGAVAFLQDCGKGQGKLVIMSLCVENSGGLSAKRPTELDGGFLKVQESARRPITTTAIRFQQTARDLTLFAVDADGKIIKNHFSG